MALSGEGCGRRGRHLLFLEAAVFLFFDPIIFYQQLPSTGRDVS